MSYNHDWKKDMDALVALTSNAWFGARESDKPKGINASLSLGPKEVEDKVEKPKA
jgi:hypothetical protein